MKIYIMLVLFWAGIAISSIPVLLSESLTSFEKGFVHTDAGRVIFSNENHLLMSVSLENPEDIQELEIEWGGLLDQWGGLGYVWNVTGSQDGSMICFTQFALIPEGYFPDSARSTPSPLIVVCCGSDGSTPRILGLTWDIVSPKFSFTRDMREVFSNAWFQCLPTPQDWVDYVGGEHTRALDPWLFVSIEDGSRSGDPSLHPRGLLFDNPLSEAVILDPDQTRLFLDMENDWVVMENRDIFEELIFEDMVLPNAFIARFPDGHQIVRFASGQEYSNPGERLDIYCILPDGRYIFTRDSGETVLLGEINWKCFQSPVSVELPGLAGLDPNYTLMESTLDGGGVLYINSSALYYLEL